MVAQTQILETKLNFAQNAVRKFLHPQDFAPNVVLFKNN